MAQSEPPKSGKQCDQQHTIHTLVTRIDNPCLLLATLPLYHPVQDLKMTPLLQFTPVHFQKYTSTLIDTCMQF